MIGKTISHYKILEKLGEGGMGVVYKAHDTKLDRTVALKFLSRYPGQDESDRQRFLQEARAASSLDHAHICSIYSIEESADGDIFIVMAFYEGVPLKTRIESSTLPLRDVVNYAIQISSGLHKAHETGIVHRDLKPANIFITQDDQIKIIDFGLAKAVRGTQLTKTGITLGTVPYMSPEQSSGDRTRSPYGKSIVFNSDRNGDLNIWLFSMEDASYRQLTRGPGGDYQPNWSPDGRRILFDRLRSSGGNIWVVGGLSQTN